MEVFEVVKLPVNGCLRKEIVPSALVRKVQKCVSRIVAHNLSNVIDEVDQYPGIGIQEDDDTPEVRGRLFRIIVFDISTAASQEIRTVEVSRNVATLVLQRLMEEVELVLDDPKFGLFGYLRFGGIMQ
jgi:hypothetical protein